MAPQVAVCGPAHSNEHEAAQATAVGRLLAAAGAIVVCGGGPGVMAAAAAGARAAGGTVLGVLPGPVDADTSPDLSAVVVTNLGQARNALIVASVRAVIAVGGSWGTLSEIALARRGDVPVITLGGWTVRAADGRPVPDGPIPVDTPEAAVALALGRRPASG